MRSLSFSAVDHSVACGPDSGADQGETWLAERDTGGQWERNLHSGVYLLAFYRLSGSVFSWR